MDSILNILISDSLIDLILNTVDNNQYECICSSGPKQLSIAQVLAIQNASSGSCQRLPSRMRVVGRGTHPNIRLDGLQHLPMYDTVDIHFRVLRHSIRKSMPTAFAISLAHFW